jgi:protein disulfide-isomerase A6
MGVQGFPTLKIVRPGKKPGKPTVEDYQGERSAKGIVNAVKDKVPNSVKRINDKSLDEWLQENKDSAKAILFSDKGVVSATLKALAIDFAGLVSVAQIKKSEKAAVEKYGITEYPSLILLQPGTEEPIKFDGKVEKDAMVKFLSQVAPPNPDCEGEEGEEGRQEGIKVFQQVRQGLCLAQVRRCFLRRCVSHR